MNIPIPCILHFPCPCSGLEFCYFSKNLFSSNWSLNYYVCKLILKETTNIYDSVQLVFSNDSYMHMIPTRSSVLSTTIIKRQIIRYSLLSNVISLFIKKSYHFFCNLFFQGTTLFLVVADPCSKTSTSSDDLPILFFTSKVVPKGTTNRDKCVFSNKQLLMSPNQK